MDLLEFDGRNLYFEEPAPEGVPELLRQAADAYHDGKAELPLLRAHLLAPDHLSVLVALYRFYFYQHRLDEAQAAACRAIYASGRRLEFPEDWRQVSEAHLSRAVVKSMGLVRFYLLALKAIGYLHLRQQNLELARERLTKVVSLDKFDRLGAGALLEIADACIGRNETSSMNEEMAG